MSKSSSSATGATEDPRPVRADVVVSSRRRESRGSGAARPVLLVAAFGLLATLVRTGWGPVRTLDLTLAHGLNDLVVDTGVLREALTVVTDFGGTAMLLWLLVIGVVRLLLRRQPRLAAFAAVAASGGMLLNAVVKELVGRLRPVVDAPVYTAPGLSFPSGHAMSSLVAGRLPHPPLVALARRRARRRRSAARRGSTALRGRALPDRRRRLSAARHAVDARRVVGHRPGTEGVTVRPAEGRRLFPER
jgi:hypothetical protein